MSKDNIKTAPPVSEDLPAFPEGMPGRRSGKIRVVFYTAFAVLVTAGLYAAGLYSYLLFHTLVELFSVIVCCAVFVIVWNSRPVQDNQYMLFLGISVLFTSVLELLHTLAYKGFGVFPGNDANLPTQLWIAFRYLFGLSFLAAPLFIRRRLNLPVFTGLYTVVTVSLISAIFLGKFPDCFVEGSGLTPFKIYSEYVIIAMLMAGLGLLVRERNFLDHKVLRLVTGAILLSVGSELSFTKYVSVFGPANMPGHFFFLASTICLYQAIVVTCLIEPSRLLYRRLQEKAETLRVSEARLSTFLEATFEGIVQSEEGRILDCNDRFARMTGYSVSELKGAAISDLVAPEDRERVAANIRDNRESVTEHGVLCKDGTRITVEARGQAMSPGGKVRYTAVLDISERKRIEEELLRAYEEQEAIFRAVPFLISMHGEDGRWLRTNPAVTDLFGFDPVALKREEVAKRLRARFADGTQLTSENMPSSRALKGEPVLGAEYMITDGRGTDRILLVNAIPLKKEEKVYGLVLAQADITERKQAEAALMREKLFFESLFQSIPGPAYVFDEEGRFVRWNRYYQTVLGYPAERMAELTVLEIVASADREKVSRVIERVYREGYGATELQTLTADGKTIPMYCMGAFMEIRNKRYVIGVGIDITERKETEEQLRHAAEELQAANKALKASRSAALNLTEDAVAARRLTETMNLALQHEIAVRKQAEEALQEALDELAKQMTDRTAKLREKEVLLKEVHHRVKNNLQVISSLVSLQADVSGDAAMRRVLRDVIDRVRSMALVHEKLYQSVDLAGIDFAEYAKSLLSFLWRAHGTGAIRLKLDLEPVSLAVDTAVPCGLILNELVVNSLEHAFAGRDEGEVTVSLRRDTAGRICLSVSDNGIGLSAGEKRDRSLGLSLVHMLAGQIDASVKTSSNNGTHFEIAFFAQAPEVTAAQ